MRVLGENNLVDEGGGFLRTDLWKLLDDMV